MRNVRVATMIILLVLGVLVPPSRAEKHSPIAEQLAKAYGLDAFSQIEQIRYTWNAEFGKFKISRTWVWEPNTDRISYEGKDDAGKPVKVTYMRSQLSSQPAMVKDQIEPSFFNDQYWLLLPFRLYWDGSAEVTDTGRHKLPIGKGSAERVLVKYPSQGGFTPGDTWELFVGDDHRIKEFIYHRSVDKKPKLVVASYADYKKAGPLLISTDHQGTGDGNPLRVFFSNVSVKLVGTNNWVNAQ